MQKLLLLKLLFCDYLPIFLKKIKIGRNQLEAGGNDENRGKSVKN